MGLKGLNTKLKFEFACQLIDEKKTIISSSRSSKFSGDKLLDFHDKIFSVSCSLFKVYESG